MNLLVFLSNRCNMACDYCFLDLNKGKAVVLDTEKAKRGFKHFFSSSRATPGQVTFLGGEPLIHYDRLEALAGDIASTAPAGTSVGVVTNGTLASSDKVRALRAKGVEITVSLDGDEASHDRHRALLGAAKRSALGAALEQVGRPGDSGVKANIVISPDTAANLMKNVEFLRQLGFRRLSFHVDVLGAWTAGALASLRASLEAFGRYHALMKKDRPGELEITHLSSYGAPRRAEPHDYDDLVLGADGKFYPCDGLFAAPYDSISDWSVGDAEEGIDWEKRAALHLEAQRFIHSRLDGKGHYTCSREPYFHALAAGRDPSAAVRNFQAADRVLGDALRTLA